MVLVGMKDIGELVENTAPVDSETCPTNKKEAFERDENRILSLCRERRSLDSTIFIPWNNIQLMDVVSPTVLSLRIVVQRYFGENSQGDEIYREVEVEVFVVECPAARIYALISGRMQLKNLRHDLKILLSTGSINGDMSDLHYCDFTGVVRDDNGCITPRELSLGSRTIEWLHEMTIEIELHINELNESISQLSDPAAVEATQEAILCQTFLLGRVKLYIATLLSASLLGPSYDEADIKRVIEADRREALQLFESATDDQIAKNTVSFLLDMAEIRVRDYALCGWSHQGNLLESCLTTIINGYYINIVEALGYFFDSKDALESLKGNESKLKLIEFVIENDNRFNIIVENALLPYHLHIAPRPVLSLSLNTTTLMTWYSDLLQKEMGSFVRRAFEIALSSTNNNTPDAYFTPWEYTSDDGVLVSSIPLDTENLLENYLSLVKDRFSKRFVSADVKAGLIIIEQNMEEFYISCLSRLAELYHDFLGDHDWTTPVPLEGNAKYDDEVEFQALGDHLDWLSSVTNDCVRMSHRLLGDSSGLNALQADFVDSAKEKMEGMQRECFESLQRTSQFSLEFISSIFFKSFEGVVPTSKKFYSWEANSEMVEKFVEDVMWYLSTRYEHLHPQCRSSLLEVCLKKVLVWYLSLIKESAKDSSIRFTTGHYNRIEMEVNKIVESFKTQNQNLVTEEDVNNENNKVLHELYFFRQIIALLTKPIGSVDNTKAICNILDDVKAHPAECKAISHCIRNVFKIRLRSDNYAPDEVNEYNVYPRDCIHTMSSKMERVAKQFEKDNYQMFSLGAYILVFESDVSVAKYFVHSAKTNY